MSTFANNDECLSSHHTSSNFPDNDGQSDVLSKNDSNTENHESESDSETDCSSENSSWCDYSFLLSLSPHSKSISLNCSELSNSWNYSEDLGEEIDVFMNSINRKSPVPESDTWGCETKKTLCNSCKVTHFKKVQTKVKCLHQIRRSISEILRIIQ